MNNKNKKAFTLIELLVVIAIIGILATLAVVALQQARKNARDAKRIADVKQIQTALELYYNQVGSYPELASITANNSIEHNGTVYMAIFPSAPTPADGNCNSSTNQYSYTPTGTANSSYQLSFCLGNQVGNINQGEKCATPAGILTTNCAGQISGGGSTPPPAWACGDDLIDDRDSNVYPTVQIGTQCWMAKNLAYLPEVQNNSSFVSRRHSSLPAYGVYSYNGGVVSTAKDHSNYITYGVLYNFYAVDQINICPDGWYVPTETEWNGLIDYLSSNSQYWCGGNFNQILKSLANSSGWTSHATVCRVGNNQSSNNISGFSILPAGYRDPSSGNFGNLVGYAYFWSSSADTNNAWSRNIGYLDSEISRGYYHKGHGFSVRCLKD